MGNQLEAGDELVVYLEKGNEQAAFSVGDISIVSYWLNYSVFYNYVCCSLWY